MGEILKKVIRKQIYVFLNSAIGCIFCAINVHGTNAVSAIVSTHFSLVLQKTNSFQRGLVFYKTLNAIVCNKCPRNCKDYLEKVAQIFPPFLNRQYLIWNNKKKKTTFQPFIASLVKKLHGLNCPIYTNIPITRGNAVFYFYFLYNNLLFRYIY